MPARLRVLSDRPDYPGALGNLQRLGRRILAMAPAERAAYLSARTRNERAICEYALGVEGVGWRASPVTMAAHLDRTYRERRHQVLLAAHFRRMVHGIEPRQLWMLPARYGKTWMVRWGLTWALDLDPTANWIFTSYVHELAVESGVAVRGLIEEHRANLQVRLRTDRRKANRWSTDMGGGLLATGIHGSIAGFGAGGGLIGCGGGVVLDDPYKNWQAAHSKTERDAVGNAYKSVLRMRLNNEDAGFLIDTTRWHEDDIQGRILQAMVNGDEDEWTVVRLAARAEAPDQKAPPEVAYLRDPDPLGRAVGEVLDPDLFDDEDVAARHRVLGSYLTASLEQGRPAPEEGGEIKRGWWKWGHIPQGRPDDALTSWDMKMKDTSDAGDFVVGGVWLRYAGTAWLVDLYRGQWNFNETKMAIALAAVRHPTIQRHIIENTGNGPEVIAGLRRPWHNIVVDDATAGRLGMAAGERDAVEALLRRGMSGLLPENPEGDKVTRTRTYSAPLIEAGDVWLPVEHESGWGLTVVNEHATFPKAGAHDDIVDMTSQALKHLLGRDPSSTTVPTGTVRMPQPGHVRLPAGAGVPGLRMRPR